MANTAVFPWECRDREDQAKTIYNHPLRRVNLFLNEENKLLKRLLLSNRIPWSAISNVHIKGMEMTMNEKSTSSMPLGGTWASPRLPTEVLLRILKFAMTSPYPIIDPLSIINPDNLTAQEKSRGNQIAIHFLATCKAMHTEGTRFLWSSNEFIFTSPQALHNFGDLPAHFRLSITHLSLRVVAQYYDDQRRRHKLERCYHSDLKKDQLLKVHLRPKETPLIRGGFRCYTWHQVTDFLLALRAPYDPIYEYTKAPRPRLLPSLTTLRLDLINFSDTLLPFSGSELHEITSHELGCTLNELQVTGMPFDDAGMKASAELSGLLKDEGLYLDGPAAFVAHADGLDTLSGDQWCARVIRAWKGDKDSSDLEDDDDIDDEEDDELHHAAYHPRIGVLPAAPAEDGHPESIHSDDQVIWKKIPILRDRGDRKWAQFARLTGYELKDPDCRSDGENRLCACCGDIHPGSSYTGFSGDFEFV